MPNNIDDLYRLQIEDDLCDVHQVLSELFIKWRRKDLPLSFIYFEMNKCLFEALYDAKQSDIYA